MSNNKINNRAPVGLVMLLSTALLINYVDRGSIATAAPLLEKELSLSASEMGWVLAVFYWAYAPMQPVMGWCADRFGPARVLADRFRAVEPCHRGDGSGRRAGRPRRVAFADGRRRVRLLPERAQLAVAQRARRYSVAVQRRRCSSAPWSGPALGTLLGGLIMVRFGWRAMFLVMGLASLRLARFLAALDAQRTKQRTRRRTGSHRR